MKRVKWVKHTVMEGDETLGGEHSMQYTDDVLIELYTWNLLMLLINATPNKFHFCFLLFINQFIKSFPQLVVSGTY